MTIQGLINSLQEFPMDSTVQVSAFGKPDGDINPHAVALTEISFDKQSTIVILFGIKL